MARLSIPHQDRAAKAAEAKERAAARKSYAVSDEEFGAMVAAHNKENPRRSYAKMVADKYIAPDGGAPIDLEAETERLAGLSTFKFERERKAAAKALGLRAGALDQIVSQKRKKSTAKAPPTTFDVNELKRSAAHIIAHGDVLDLFTEEFGKVIAGEKANGKLLYLVGTSRLFDKTMHGAIKGTSAGGKSEIRKRILEFFRPRVSLLSPVSVKSP